jgi:superfamily II DNA or RNA helicase/HKD family nuclease
MNDLKEGLYDQLITRRLRRSLEALDPTHLSVQTEELEENDCPDYLARHLVRQIKLALRSLPSADRKQRQIELANKLLDQSDLEEESRKDFDPVDRSGEILRAIYSGPEPPKRPTTPLAVSNLLMNAVGEPRLGFELEQEMTSADRVFMVVSFVQWRGWQRLKKPFLELADRGIPIRLLTTTYIGATDFRAIEEIARLRNVEVKISLDGRRRRLHAKAWLFERDSGFSSVYVGSANLSGPALEDGIEWTVKLSEVEAPHIVQRFHGAFDSLWSDEEFELFRSDDKDFCQRVKLSLQDARKGPVRGAERPVFFDLRPHPYQQATLDQLESERTDRGNFRNLVVAPTGTGKTLIAAFDYARQPFHGNRPRLLFLAHREELLRQAREQFRHVLRDESFGDLLYGHEEPVSFDHLFSTIQSFRSRGLLESCGPNHWAFVVLDEAHHVPAQGYRDIISSLRPQILLGLTATPERMDGESILPWFDNRMADEMRLWHAIERQYLVPFDYYGIYDGTDLSQLSWTRGSYAIGELERQYLGNERRANLIVNEFWDKYGDWRQARALGFCVSIAHARFMAKAFQGAGIPAMAITSESPDEDRAQASAKLRARMVNVLFTVDLFNEGVDIPEADCVLFLRPTESATIFLQQLGRGLRLDTGKNSCLVLDFIGNQRREFRFDQRFRGLIGGTRQQIVHELDTGITALPGNCYFRLDKESRRLVLENLKTRLLTSRARMVQELKATAEFHQRCPTLLEYLSETGYELSDVYKPSVGGWGALHNEAELAANYHLCQSKESTHSNTEDPAGIRPVVEAVDRPRQCHLSPHAATEGELRLIKHFHQLLHVDSIKRLALYLRLSQGTECPPDDFTLAENRMLEMLTFRLLSREERAQTGDRLIAAQQLSHSLFVRSEFHELCNVLLDGVKFHAEEYFLIADCPIFLHRRYTRDEILVGLGMSHRVGARDTQTGRFFISAMNTEVLFVTLDKSEKTFSPSTRYEDYAISQTCFHWQSQSTTSDESPTGQRYINQCENGSQFQLFVRPRKEDPFVFLGPLRYLCHVGSRPMSIKWELQHPMPAWFFEICASLRAA